ncbi:MAG: DUF5666 domain-containing protein, partial [Gammaproteobacteria bacterium]|nr:DUF5666 domain-containing protein [Gammaproteobacteria bacterium]
MWFNKLMILLLSLALTACFHSEDEADDGHDHQHKIEGEVLSVDDTGFSVLTENGDQVAVVITTNTVVADATDANSNLTDLEVGDLVEVQGNFDANTLTVNAVRIELDNDPVDDKEPVMVVGAGLGAPTVSLDVDVEQDADSHVEVHGVVSSVAGNAVVVDVTSVEHTTANVGTQMTVMLSGDFIKLGAMSDIAVGDAVELKGKLDSNNSFVIQVMKVKAVNTITSDDDVADEVDSSGASVDTDDDLETNDDVNSADEDDDTTTEAVEVKAVVSSLTNGILVVNVTGSKDITIAVNTEITIDTANVQVSGMSVSGLAVGDEVELKGSLDTAGNFVVTAVEVESNDGDSHSMQGNNSNGMSTMDQKVSGVVTAVGSDAI